MIVGSGLIANAILNYKIDNDGLLFFAKGVSNSNETNSNEFDREQRHLIDCIENNKEKVFIYFSSCGIASKQHTPYFKHKSFMEDIIKHKCKKYLIFRLPQVVGKSSNTNTLLNFLHKNLVNKNKINIWINATRNLIDVDDVVAIIHKIILSNLFTNQIISIASPYNIKMGELINIIENYFNMKFIYDISEQTNEYEINISEIAKFLSIEYYFCSNQQEYINKILRKYFSNK